ncbi:hypothetical protein OG2516_12764 [Oceanicola granulosus HTCC2516]|uniref:Four-carbon acid sugar kinase family protein n=1 Tax=Oceanicola granulosus (strain ATCC BAA-861 / DSM 15982 / KCTC 12143 / HTCC2516) TaxID=314256 RepID=Q2CC28_OCEGH|nr:four-carbon acid sugar kinase family protein [Oceanicola granulosus]EAR50253.1 hypothetical protein OG2516_12764 [Oceanicola granulosus HTCC2516]
MTDLGTGTSLAFYGDDFTGSTDAMEVTAKAGLETVLFTALPDEALAARFSGYPVVGMAGTARARGAAWMEAELPARFAFLAATGAPILQYKVCSTFDSAPEVGSIGRAIEIGRRVSGARLSPVIVGAPQLGRWVTFSTLFARAGTGGVHRIDRHPTMSRHPVTPMTEGDLTRHLAAQTERAVTGLALDRLIGPDAAEVLAASGESGEIVVLDTYDEASQRAAGRLVWEARGAGVFSASSSGLQYALVAHWRAEGALASEPPRFAPLAPTPRLLALSGSCSPVTADQIARAEAAGFAPFRLDVRAVAGGGGDAEVRRLLEAVRPVLAEDRPALIFAAKTVDDPAYAGLADHCRAEGIPFERAQARIGHTLGAIAREAVPALGLTRLAVAGGDTSGAVVEALPVGALELRAPLAPGAPVCLCHSDDPAYAGLEVLLKGGQLGHPDVFTDLAIGPRG